MAGVIDTKAPLVSIVVPNYNHAQFLQQRLDSIYGQTFRDFDVIILDDCSNDNSREIIMSYADRPNTSYLFREMNSGSPFAQWMTGIDGARGKYIWVAESDDFCDANFLEVAVPMLEQGADLFYCRSERVNQEGNKAGEMNDWYSDLSPTRWTTEYQNSAADELTQYLFRKNTIVNASAVVFRKKPEILGWLNEVAQMRYCGDWIFWMNYLRATNRICYSIKTTNYFRIHPGVSRRVHKQEDRNAEVLVVLKYVLELAPVEAHRDLVTYFFQNHLYKRNRSEVAFNLNAYREQRKISTHFRPLWRRYYFRSKS